MLIKDQFVEILRKISNRPTPKENYGEMVDVTTDARVLFDAVRHGKTHLVRFILEASDVDVVNSRDLHGKTPLMACCYTKEEGARDNTVKLLLRHGADVNSTDDFGRTALSYACEKRCNDILRILIKEHNIDPDISDINGNTPLIFSAMVGNDIACDILIRHFRRLGLSVDAANDEGFTAILMAAKHGHTTCAQILAGQGKASLLHRDRKFGLSVEEWLAKKGFTMQDITPVRHDGKGRSRFIKLANIAAVCTGPKKNSHVDRHEINYHGTNVRIEKFTDAESYFSDSSSGKDQSSPRFILDKETAALKHYKVYPLSSRPKLKHQETQTLEDEDASDGNNNSDAETLQTTFDMDQNKHCKKGHKKYISPERKSSKTNLQNKSPETKRNQLQPRKSEKRFSLPNIDARTYRRDSLDNSPRKQSLDVLPEKLIANIDLGDGRRQSIQLYADTLKNQVYWSPYKVEDEEYEDENQLVPLKFDRAHVSVSDSETSTNDDGPMF